MYRPAKQAPVSQLGAQDSTKWPTYYDLAPRLAQVSVEWSGRGAASTLPSLPSHSQASALPGFGITDTTGMVAAYDLGDMSSPYPPAHVHFRCARMHDLCPLS